MMLVHCNLIKDGSRTVDTACPAADAPGAFLVRVHVWKAGAALPYERLHAGE